MDEDLFGHEAPAQVLSPCVNVCRLDPATGWCVGCGRTGDEIARWSAASDADRATMLVPLAARLSALMSSRQP
ncbi:hypothetical protein SAMN06297144_3305 [Sphingomonas guangdongensis]|uniref:DUF1289 domain-containing protein n=1 Tax=Sphingomonas guangdongensis TaxID=1141890 RepID=A0A285R227_9SPHN|nr:DUF1289 domain-containing protein [Sphingomonas guangdongensis]SOB88160.1 hypothetical protein SAMN06297144_3305 [Sphingomonas guangdongensis]